MNKDAPVNRAANDRARRNLRRAMCRAGLDVKTLGGLLPSSYDRDRQRLVRRHLTGETRLTLDQVAEYARVLHADPAVLAFGEVPYSVALEAS